MLKHKTHGAERREMRQKAEGSWQLAKGKKKRHDQNKMPVLRISLLGRGRGGSVNTGMRGEVQIMTNAGDDL
jgi:hypothetical protein